MALVKIKDFEPDYREAFGGYDIKGLDVYSDINNEKIGTVHDLLVDEHEGRFRYFIVDLGFWGFGKKVMLPVDRARVDNDGKHLYALGLSKDQAENLAEFNESLRIDDDRRHDLQESLRQPVGNSRPSTVTRPPQAVPPSTQIRALEHSAPLEHPVRTHIPPTGQPTSHPTGYTVPPQPVSPPIPSQPYPSAASMPTTDRTAYSTHESVADSRMQSPYSQGSAYSGSVPPHPSILQRFEERLRAKRMQSS